MDIAGLLARYRPADEDEAIDVARVRELVKTREDPWRRSIPLHLTASAVVVHPDTGRVLLRWHRRQRERDPIAVALREGREETGLTDLVPWPDAGIVHVAVVPVPANDVEPAHEHADVRFLLATGDPGAARPERPDAPLRWLGVREARELTTEPNVRETLSRAQARLAPGG
jgi:8-oxo-dGTP pyrophosphatase MutT (NUDIX family)